MLKNQGFRIFFKVKGIFKVFFEVDVVGKMSVLRLVEVREGECLVKDIKIRVIIEINLF